MSPYECGMEPVGDARQRFTVKFYLVAMLFILFDVEAVFLYPWASSLEGPQDVRLLGDAGVYRRRAGRFHRYIWKKGVIDWNKPSQGDEDLADGLEPAITDIELAEGAPGVARCLLASARRRSQAAKFDRNELTIWVDRDRSLRGAC